MNSPLYGLCTCGINLLLLGLELAMSIQWCSFIAIGLFCNVHDQLQDQGLPAGAGGHSQPSVGKWQSRSPIAQCSAQACHFEMLATCF